MRTRRVCPGDVPAAASEAGAAVALIIVVLVLAGCGRGKEERRDAGQETGTVSVPEVSRAVFTSGLDAEDRPVDDIGEISADRPSVYLFVEWDNLTPNKEYEVAYTVVDGRGAARGRAYHGMTPTGRRWATWYPYAFKETGALRATGPWTFFIELDGVDMGFRSLRVAEGETTGGSGSPSADQKK
jgi:hypothetical protein